MKKTEKIFRSRISVLLSVLVLAPLLLISINMFKHQILIGLIILVGTLLFIILIFTGMRYVISDGKLFLRMWFIPNGSVNIADILSVERSYNPLSSPAASLKRLRISLREGAKYPYLLISPVREQEFIEALKAVKFDIYVKIPDKKGIWRVWDWDF